VKHYLNSALIKGAAPYFDPSGGGQGGIYTGAVGQKPTVGPRGGRIKAYNPTTGKPIYYKPWESGQGYSSHPVQDGHKGKSPSGDYEVYQKGSVIGRTASGQPIHADSNINNTKSYMYEDHRDAHHAHFSLAQYIKQLIAKRLSSEEVDDKAADKLKKLYEAHMNFSQHHNEQAILDLLHGKTTPASQKDLSKEREKVPTSVESRTKGGR